MLYLINIHWNRYLTDALYVSNKSDTIYYNKYITILIANN